MSITFNHPATTEFYPLSLHDALPISGSLLLNLEGPLAPRLSWRGGFGVIRYWPADQEGIFLRGGTSRFLAGAGMEDRKSTRLNSSHMSISYAVFCLTKNSAARLLSEV